MLHRSKDMEANVATAKKNVTPDAKSAPKATVPVFEEIVEAVTEAQAKVASEVEAAVSPAATKGVKTMTNEAIKKTEEVIADINTKAKDAFAKVGKTAEELTAFNKGNIEAVIESAKIAAKGIETMGQDAVEYGRKSFEDMTANAKKVATVKSPTEFFQLQSEMAQKSFDMFVAQASKNSEAALKLAGDVFQPISNRFAVAAEKLKIAA